MSRYAAQTAVSADRSRDEIERLLLRYHASGFMYAWHGNTARLAFELRGRRVQFTLSMPDRREFTHTPAGHPRTDKSQAEAYAQELRRRWRSLALLIKAKLVAIDDGIKSFDEEFLPNIVLPGGETIGERLVPAIDHACTTGNLPPLLPGAGSQPIALPAPKGSPTP